MSSLFKNLFCLPETDAIDLDSDQAITAHQTVIFSKPFLKKLYENFYGEFSRQGRELTLLHGHFLELGSGGGFLKSVFPEVITSDVCENTSIDRVIFADKLPFKSGDLKGIFCLNVLHHIAAPERFFSEAQRVLVSRGRVVLIEPSNSIWARFFYKNFHHEPFDETALSWDREDKGRLTTSNQALCWIIFHRDRSLFEKRFPGLRIKSIKAHTVTRYALSGGLTYRAFVPAFTFPLFAAIDAVLSMFPSIFPVFETVILEKS